jgi:hypothetical protein
MELLEVFSGRSNLINSLVGQQKEIEICKKNFSNNEKEK